MSEQKRKGYIGLALVFVFVFCIIAIFVSRIWLHDIVKETKESAESVASIQPQTQPEPAREDTAKIKPIEKQETTNSSVEEKTEEQKITGPLTVKTRVQRGADYIENFFYRGDKQVASQKISTQGIIEQTGEIPDGKVNFVDSYENTTGEEHYRDGKKHGPSKAYYDNGQLKIDAYYADGKLQTKKEYFKNGALKSEIDYTDARNYPGDSEVGVGKFYLKDGTLMYEWNITKRNKTGFKKSYNRNGTLRATLYYDEYGKLIQTKY